MEKVQAHNALLQGVVLTREAALDSASYRNLSTIGRAQVVASQGELVQFDTGEYIERLVSVQVGVDHVMRGVSFC